MGVLGTVLSNLGSWFGFVGACVVTPVPACRPFLAFIALAISSTVCLLLVAVAVRSIWHNERRAREKPSKQPTAPGDERIEPVLAMPQREAASRTEDRWHAVA